jgi:hypothetical protein
MAAGVAGRPPCNSWPNYRCSPAGVCHLQDLCEQHPLADEAVKQQLRLAAQQAEAAYEQRRRQRASAYAAFLGQSQGLGQRASAAGEEAQPAGAGNPESIGTGTAGRGCDVGLDVPLAQEVDIEGGGFHGTSGVSVEDSGLSNGDSAPLVAPAQACGWTEDEQAAFVRIMCGRFSCCHCIAAIIIGKRAKAPLALCTDCESETMYTAGRVCWPHQEAQERAAAMACPA